MTVPYGRVTRRCGLPRLLARWRGSIFKLVWPDYLVFISLYFILSGVYRLALTTEQQLFARRIAHYADTYSAIIPLSFVLGFYVSLVIKRWWEQWQCVPYVDGLALI